MPEPVNIPVQVTGAEQAKAELRNLGATVEQTGRVAQPGKGKLTAESFVADQAASKVAAETAAREAAAKDTAVGATDRLTGATDRGTFANEGYSRASRGMIGHILGVVNPALGQTFLVVSELYRGFTRMTSVMLGLAGGAVALGVLVAVFERMAEAARKAEEAIKRALEARREAAGEALSIQKQVADAFEKAGVPGGAPEATAAAAAMMVGRPAGAGGEPARAGLEKDLAVFGVTAREVAGRRGKELSDDDVRRMIGAWVATGRKDDFTGDQAANQRLLDKLARVPADLSTRALAARQRDVGAPTANEPPGVPTTSEEQWRVAAVKEMQRSGKYTKEEAETAERLAGGEAPGKFRSWWSALWGEGHWTVAETPKDVLRATAKGSSRTLGELVEALRAEVEMLKGRAPDGGAGAGVTLNIVTQHHTTHVATNYGSLPPTRSPSVLSPDGF